MKNHHHIRASLEADGFMITMLIHGEVYTVAALKGGKIHIVQAEHLDTAYLEIQRSISEENKLVG